MLRYFDSFLSLERTYLAPLNLPFTLLFTGLWCVFFVGFNAVSNVFVGILLGIGLHETLFRFIPLWRTKLFWLSLAMSVLAIAEGIIGLQRFPGTDQFGFDNFAICFIPLMATAFRGRDSMIWAAFSALTAGLIVQFLAAADFTKGISMFDFLQTDFRHENRIHVGMVIAISLTATLAALFHAAIDSSWRLRMRIIVTVIGVTLLLLLLLSLGETFSRGAWFGAAAGTAFVVCAYLAYAARKGPWAFTVIAATSALGILILTINIHGNSPFSQRMEVVYILVKNVFSDYTTSNNYVSLTNNVGKSISERFSLIDLGYNAFQNKPFFGWGNNVSRFINISESDSDLRKLGSFHNTYVELLVRYGIVGFLMYALAFFLCASALLRALREQRISFLAFVVVASTTMTFLVTCLTNSNLFLQMGFHFMILAGGLMYGYHPSIAIARGNS